MLLIFKFQQVKNKWKKSTFLQLKNFRFKTLENVEVDTWTYLDLDKFENILNKFTFKPKKKKNKNYLLQE